ncbi:hypothetical protein [Blastococcus montanus]|uniref:hypothetical protein n=1 Tax=Blastococcus montanus TaxID=3144973 RepID=UPI003207B2FD
MRRSLLRCGILPAAAALAVLTGCTSDEPDITGSEETTAAETTSGSGTETETETETGAAADEEFCTAASTIQERIAGSASANPADLPQTFRDAAEEIRSIEAPPELAPDWTALADGVEQFAATLQDIDLTDPNALATLEQQLAPLEQELTQASANVETYLAEECGIGTTEESTPTS